MANCGASVRDGKAARASRVGHRGRLPIIIEVGSGRGRRSRVYESTRQGAYSKTGLVGSAGMSAIPRFADPKSDIALGPISAITGSQLIYRSIRRRILPRQSISAL